MNIYKQIADLLVSAKNSDDRASRWDAIDRALRIAQKNNSVLETQRSALPNQCKAYAAFTAVLSYADFLLPINFNKNVL